MCERRKTWSLIGAGERDREEDCEYQEVIYTGRKQERYKNKCKSKERETGKRGYEMK
jgi:hypothetical protein